MINTNYFSLSTEVHSKKSLEILQTALPKKNGYPSLSFHEAIDVLSKQSLKPTLLLIDEVGIAPVTKPK